MHISGSRRPLFIFSFVSPVHRSYKLSGQSGPLRSFDLLDCCLSTLRDTILHFGSISWSDCKHIDVFHPGHARQVINKSVGSFPNLSVPTSVWKLMSSPQANIIVRPWGSAQWSQLLRTVVSATIESLPQRARFCEPSTPLTAWLMAFGPRICKPVDLIVVLSCGEDSNCASLPVCKSWTKISKVRITLLCSHSIFSAWD